MPRYKPHSDSSSGTSLSENTDQIVSFWHRYLSHRRLRSGSDASPNSTAALVSDYLAAIPYSSSTNISETITEESSSPLSEHGHRRSLRSDQTSWASALGLALLALTASLLLAAVSLTVYNIQPASRVFGTNAELETTPPEADTGVSILMAARAFKTGQRFPPPLPRTTTRTSRRTRSVTVKAVARHEVTTKTLTMVTPRDRFSTGHEEVSVARLMCGAVYYSYCTRSTPKFYYDPWWKTCMASRGSSAATCLTGSNRFPSKARCESTCVHSERGSPRCADATTFSSCTRRDYRGTSLWYFNGRNCRLWQFPTGKCPSRADGVVLFRTVMQCEKKCGSGTRHGVQPRPSQLACRVPRPVRCRPHELKYTHFAIKSATSTRCLPISAPALARRRCLSGANRFATRASCERMCVRRRHHSAVQHDGDGA